MNNKQAGVGLCLALLAGVAQAEVQPEAQTVRFYGYAYDRDSGEYLYTEVHAERVDGDRWFGGAVRYYAPDGRLIGDKTLDFSRDPYIPLYRLDLLQQHYSEAITAIGKDTLTMEKTSGGQSRSKTIERQAGMAADAGFHNLILAHFAELMAGRRLKFTLAVAGELDSYHFRIEKTGDTRFDGRAAVELRVEPDSLLRLLVDPLRLSYDVGNHHLLEYVGVSNIHDPATGSAYNVRIIYPSQAPPDAPKTLPPLD